MFKDIKKRPPIDRFKTMSRSFESSINDSRSSPRKKTRDYSDSQKSINETLDESIDLDDYMYDESLSPNRSEKSRTSTREEQSLNSPSFKTGLNVNTSTPVNKSRNNSRNTSNVKNTSKRSAIAKKNDFADLRYYSVFIVLPIFYFLIRNVITADNGNSTVIKNDIMHTFKKIEHHFPVKDSSLIWGTFYSGIVDVLQDNRPAVFLLIHKKKDAKLAKNIANYVGDTFSDQIFKQVPIFVDSSYLNSYISDHGKIISKYRNTLEQQGAIIIYNLQLLKGEVARALHIFCDKVTPLVNRAVIILTMEVTDTSDQSTVVAENAFKTAWSNDLKSDLLWPLITRLTENVIKIEHEPES